MTARHLDLSLMRDADSWVSPAVVDDFVAEQLDRGALAIVLGAGVSMPFGLPSWKKLVAAIGKALGCTLDPDESLDEQAERIFNHSKITRTEFASVVRSELYNGVDSSFSALLNSKLLAALGAMSMPSRRGNVKTIVTLNFDDLLERFLSYYGFSSDSVDEMPIWSTRADVRVFHPHGVLRSDLGKPVARPVVFTRADYDQIVGVNDNGWRTTLIDLMASHTCIFIGLSGSDTNLSSILMKVKDIHSGRTQGYPFWGIRLADPADTKGDMWKARGVVQRTLDSYDHVPGWLADICQRAAARYEG